MTFAWPAMLALLLAAPLLVVAYLALLRRRARRAAELAAQGFVPTAAALRLRRLRHVPFAFFLAGLTLLLFAMARPQMRLSIPRREGTVILAFDVSNSMRATDLKPTRIEAAKVAARAFVEKQPSSIEIGVVAFSDGSLVTQQPTKDKDQVLAAINRLAAQGGTSLGQGIFASLRAIVGGPIKVDASANANVDADTAAGRGGAGDSAANPDAGTGNFDNVEIGYYSSAAIVLLSDGENTAQPDPLELAALSSTAGVKIYPVGIGSTDETVVEIDGFSVATALDEELLEGIASVTDGRYFRADDASSLAGIYDTIDLQWRSEAKRSEVTAIVSVISTLLLAVGAALSLFWFGRLV